MQVQRRLHQQPPSGRIVISDSQPDTKSVLRHVSKHVPSMALRFYTAMERVIARFVQKSIALNKRSEAYAIYIYTYTYGIPSDGTSRDPRSNTRPSEAAAFE